jgi:hypothetical protein
MWDGLHPGWDIFHPTWDGLHPGWDIFHPMWDGLRPGWDTPYPMWDGLRPSLWDIMAFSRMLDKFSSRWVRSKTLTRIPQISEFREWF